MGQAAQEFVLQVKRLQIRTESLLSIIKNQDEHQRLSSFSDVVGSVDEEVKVESRIVLLVEV